jgi:hypothetical protein
MSMANIQIYVNVPEKLNIYKPRHYVTSCLQDEKQTDI